MVPTRGYRRGAQIVIARIHGNGRRERKRRNRASAAVPYHASRARGYGGCVSVYERSGRACRTLIFDQSRYGAGISHGKIPHDRSFFGIGADSRDLNVRIGSGSIACAHREIGRTDREAFGVVIRERDVREKSGGLEFLLVELEFYVIGISGRIVRPGNVPGTSGKRIRIPVDDYEPS